MSASPEQKNFWTALGETQTIVSLLILYCAVQFLTRHLLSPALNAGEANQVLFGQSFQWSYRPAQPPLMTWLSWAVLTPSHDSRLALFLLREILLALGLVAFFAAARAAMVDVGRAGLSTFFLLATFGVGWLLQAGNPEHVLLAAVCSFYLWADVRALTTQRLVDYLLLGAVTSLGVLSSYIFLVLPLGTAVGLAFSPSLRARLRVLPLLAGAAVALVIVLPYFAFAGHAAGYSVLSAERPALGGLRDLALALVVFALPAALIFLVLYPRVARPLAPPGPQDWSVFFRISMAAAAIASAAVVLLFQGSSGFAFAYPVLLPLPLYLFLRANLAYGDDKSAVRDKRFALAVLACIVVGIGLRIWMYETRAHDCRHCAEYLPMPRFADTFRRAGFYSGTIVAPSAALAGNLRLSFPESRVVIPDAPAATFGPPLNGECLVVWDGNDNIPPRLRDYVTQSYGAKLEERAVQGDVEAALLTGATRRVRMNFLILANGACDHPRG